MSNIKPERARRGSGCPTCGKPSAAAHIPFCSQGCRDRDLLQWLSDGHRIPGPPVDEEDRDSGD
ncbi:DNA gyrase inhibitor YacG [Sphingomonas naphthae]|uniref:DNA gyrase inhibitor YacG n=1 Tax=Sphingomonas naphthae TaxID=1813468 RepID=A0ABY7TJ83_9SPHN|nr:DNA gyrase inhibitor YacG [Sphingomonas naphthae]WCT73005.1 DNA gyrase inhibitor YacG [Sphingomonas naphthae]